MTYDKTNWAQVDEESRLVLPADLSRRYGIEPGARRRIEADANSLILHQPTKRLGNEALDKVNNTL